MWSVCDETGGITGDPEAELHISDRSPLVEQSLVALLDGDILPDHHHPVGLPTGGGLVRKLGHRFGREAKILELALEDGGLFHVLGPLPRLGLNRIRRASHQRRPPRGRQRVRRADQIRARIVPEYEAHAVPVPPVQVLRLAEIRIAAEGDPAKPRGVASR